LGGSRMNRLPSPCHIHLRGRSSWETLQLKEFPRKEA
jgi:hypothetical protein